MSRCGLSLKRVVLLLTSLEKPICLYQMWGQLIAIDCLGKFSGILRHMGPVSDESRFSLYLGSLHLEPSHSSMEVQHLPLRHWAPQDMGISSELQKDFLEENAPAEMGWFCSGKNGDINLSWLQLPWLAYAAPCCTCSEELATAHH